MKRQW